MAKKSKRLYRLKGAVEKFGPIFEEYAEAYSEAQAKLLIHQRMDERYPHRRNFIRWASVEIVRELPRKTLPPV